MINKRILVLNGSARANGNTDIILSKLITSALQTDVQIKQIDVRKKKIRDCIGCYHCQENTACSIKDDMVEVYEEINRSALIIFASPVYWWGVTGILKVLIDRLYLYYSDLNKPDIAGKKAIIISPMHMNSDIYKIKIFLDFYKIIFDNLKMTLVDTCLFGNVNEKGAIQKNTEYLNKIDRLGKTLFDRLM
ncbi:MAG: flavodoxin family protein [Desulfobacterales bacterium]